MARISLNRSTALYFSKPNFGLRARFIERINEISDSTWSSSNSPMVQDFERRIADYLRVNHTVAVCNATVGVGMAARAL